MNILVYEHSEQCKMCDYTATMSFRGNSLTLTPSTDFGVFCAVYPAGKTAPTGLKPGTISIWQVYLNLQRMQSNTYAMKIMSN